MGYLGLESTLASERGGLNGRSEAEASMDARVSGGLGSQRGTASGSRHPVLAAKLLTRHLLVHVQACQRSVFESEKVQSSYY